MNVIVKESRIHGKGVFALRDFKKGEVVLDWSDSPVLTPEEAEEVPDEEKKFIYYGEGKLMMIKPPARFVNHSCDANTFIRDCGDIAKRDIKKGEEITEDYSEENNPHLRIECNCGSSKCRDVISYSRSEG